MIYVQQKIARLQLLWFRFQFLFEHPLTGCPINLVKFKKRKFYKNTCQWVYKGAECQYPGPGTDPIPGDDLGATANSNPIAANNQIAADASGDVCAKSLLACTLRNNQIHFGGFPGTGRTIPRS